MTMNSCILSLILALSAPSAMVVAFSPSQAARPSSSSSKLVLNSLRDIASYPDNQRMMSEYEAFDRNGAFSRSPQGGMGGRQDMMMNPFSRRGDDRMYTRDGFDPYSAYGNSFGMSQSDNRRSMMGPGGPPMMGGMEMGGGGYYGGSDMMNGVRNDNTMGGFSYSSRVRGYGQGRPFDPQGYEYEMFDGPPPMGGEGGMGMEYGGGMERGYGGFEGDMSRMGP